MGPGGPGGPRGMRGPRPKVENPGKLLARVMKYVFQDYLIHCIFCGGSDFCKCAGKCTGNFVYQKSH